MKSKPSTLMGMLAATAVWLAPAPPLGSQPQASPMELTCESSNDCITLHWDGALGVRLQRSTDLSSWQEVPNSEGKTALTLPITGDHTFFRLADLGLDVDRDEVYDSWETEGWLIAVDIYGYGDPTLVELREVSSDATLEDTDDDGLTDGEEWVIGSDPRSRDTDRDGLTDFDEWIRWHSSPTSVDTDGDACGPDFIQPPKAMLFDGNEISALRTSPTLEDTDGDGRTDCEEYDQPGRNLLVAEIPKVNVELVDAVDVRLDVQYAEEAGSTHEYGGELTVTDAEQSRYSTSASVNWSITTGIEATVGFEGWKPQGSLTASLETTLAIGATVGFERETSKSVAKSHSDYMTDSRTRTETTASGSMSGGIRLHNTGPVTYTLRDLGMSVRYLLPGETSGATGEFQTLATLVPALGSSGITLAPGDSTPVLQVRADGLNASRVKQFISRPNSLYLEPAFYEIENAAGLNFDFLEETTRWRTARVQIDFGDGRSEEYRIATNVARNEDGSYAGVTLGGVMGDILGIPFATVAGSDGQGRILESVRGLTNFTNGSARGFWMLGLTSKAAAPATMNFEDVVLKAGDDLLLIFARDTDGDGLYAAEEQHYRTDDDATTDSDGDGLDDDAEVRDGWPVTVSGRTYHVYSDPSQADQDGDGLDDSDESNKGTDPTRMDTDGDGLSDGPDPHPLVPAKVLYVKANAAGANNGTSWTNAYQNLQSALAEAQLGLDSTANDSDDVAEIWVAAGIYLAPSQIIPDPDGYFIDYPSSKPMGFQLVDKTSLYGGFAGGETKRSQRNQDPLGNSTVLSGDILNDDPGTYEGNATYFDDNRRNVCYAERSVHAETVLDGFSITGAAGLGGMVSRGIPTLTNILFRGNHTTVAGWSGGAAIAVINQNEFHSQPLFISDSLFLQNSSTSGGGAVYVSGYCRGAIITRCHFISNTAATGSGGALASAWYGNLTLDQCVFQFNTAKLGGAASIVVGRTSISRCEFRDNQAESGGALNYTGIGEYEIVQSLFSNNRAINGAAIYSKAFDTSNYKLHVLNSSFGINLAYMTNPVPAAIYSRGNLVVENSVLWDVGTQTLIDHTYLGNPAVVRSSCLPYSTSYSGIGNIQTDPGYVNLATGNLRLQTGSPCIDQANNFIDYQPTVPGFQLLPDTDLDGKWRVVDGDADGSARVDMGAYESQGQ